MGDSHNEAEDIVADAIKLNSDDLNEKVCVISSFVSTSFFVSDWFYRSRTTN